MRKMPTWEVEVDIGPEREELAALLDRWCRHHSPTDVCRPAVGGAHITHKARADDERSVKDETLDFIRKTFSGFEVRITDVRQTEG